MPRFRVHIGFELPFWLALREGEYSVALGGPEHRVSVSNSVNRMEIGDFFLGKQFKGVVWCHGADGERTRQELQRQNPDMPITRHPLKTVITDIREVEASDEQELRTLHERHRKAWVDDSLEVVNRLVDAYSLAALDDKTRGEAGRVAFWDVGLVVMSFWDESGSHQLGGLMQELRPNLPPPKPIDDERQMIFEGLLRMEDEYPLPPLLSVSAWAHFQRGNYRAAIVDDFNAIEVAVSEYARELAAQRGLPSGEMEGILKRLRFDGICDDLLPLVGGPRLRQWEKWPLLKEAQNIRNKVVHRGARATSSDARTVHNAAIWTLTWLVVWSAERESPSVEGSSPDAAPAEGPE